MSEENSIELNPDLVNTGSNYKLYHPAMVIPSFDVDEKWKDMILEEFNRKVLEGKNFIPDKNKDAFLLSRIPNTIFNLDNFLRHRKHQISCVFLRKQITFLQHMTQREHGEIKKLFGHYMVLLDQQSSQNNTGDHHKNVTDVEKRVYIDKEIIKDCKEAHVILAIIRRKNRTIEYYMKIIENLSLVINHGQSVACFIQEVNNKK